MLKFVTTAALATISLSLAPAYGADLCKAIALRDVAAIEAPDTMIAKGQYQDSVTEYTVNKHTGTTAFCSHGGYCYPTRVSVDGRKVETLRLTNCKIGRQFDQDENEIRYAVDVVRQKNTAGALRIDDLDNRFLEMGLCSACAGTAAELYVKHPNSRCAHLAREALEGNPVATETLRSFPAYCQITWH